MGNQLERIAYFSLSTKSVDNYVKSFTTTVLTINSVYSFTRMPIL